MKLPPYAMNRLREIDLEQRRLLEELIILYAEENDLKDLALPDTEDERLLKLSLPKRK